MSPNRARTQTGWSRRKCTKQEVTVPPDLIFCGSTLHLRSKLLENQLMYTTLPCVRSGWGGTVQCSYCSYLVDLKQGQSGFQVHFSNYTCTCASSHTATSTRIYNVKICFEKFNLSSLYCWPEEQNDAFCEEFFHLLTEG